MQDTEPTGRIRIIAIPDGEAPIEVREAWLGLILPCYPHIGYPTGHKYGALTGKEILGRPRGVFVPQAKALAVLRTREPITATWWEIRGFPQSNRYFFFSDDEILIINGVTVAPMLVFEDMERGHWHRTH